MIWRVIFVCLLGLPLLSCGGGSSPSSPDEVTQQRKLERFADPAEFTHYLKQALLVRYGEVNSNPQIYALEDSATTSASAGEAAGFSTTNTQETAVDEADRIKTDGRYLYVLASSGQHISRYDTQSGSAVLVDSKELSSTNGATAQGMYLHDGNLVALSGAHNRYSDIWFEPYHWREQTTAVFFLDTAEGGLTQQRHLLLDGRLISSRRIGSTLYLVMRESPDLPGLITYPQTEEQASANRQIIAQADVEEMLPGFSLDNVRQGALINPVDCFRVGGDDNASASVISVLAINLDSPDSTPDGSCFVGNAEAMYASTESLYLATTQHTYVVSNDIAIYPATMATEIHKFSLAGAVPEYRGSATVDGHLGWQQSRKSFRMGEHQQVLRLITFTGEQADANASPATLYTLAEDDAQDDRLKVLATLPNEASPAPLGKPGEQIYATRFLGDRGYLVTFRVIDPLYVLDLSDPTNPSVAGELEIAGYSDYLHPVGENLLLGIGKDAVAADDPWGDGRGAWYQGVKLSLFDVSDSSNPVERQNIIVGGRGTNTTVSWDHHAFSSLQQGDIFRFALPLSLHQTEPAPGSPSEHHRWQHDALYRFELDLQSSTITALEPLAPASNAAEDYSSIDLDRAVLIGEGVHYLHGDSIRSSSW